MYLNYNLIEYICLIFTYLNRLLSTCILVISKSSATPAAEDFVNFIVN